MTKVRLGLFFGLALTVCVSAAAQVHPAFGSLSWWQGDPALAALPVRTFEGAELRLTNAAVSVFLHESRRGFVGRAAWLRVRDAGGEVFLYRPIASADAGENFILSYSVANGKHDGKSWGGRNDGKLDLPFVLDSIVMGFTPPGGKVRLVSVETDEPGSATTPVAACRFEIDTGTAYHVVTSADSPVAAVFSNPSGRPARLVGTLRGLDVFERSFRQPLDVCVGAGRSVRVPLQGPLPAKGHWNVCAELDDGARKVYKSARFAWLDAHPRRTAKPVGRFRLGINFHGLWMTRDDLEIGLDALDACGCELVRVAFSGQCAVQKKGPDDWNWNEDWYFEKLKERHFAIDNLCHHLPGWIRDGSRPQMANDLAALEEFYARMAARYGTDVDYYEIGNEWDFWKPEVFEPAAAVETYLASARGVKRGCPSAKVVPNGWAAWDSACPAVRVKDFPESFMRQTHGHYDAFPIHLHGEFTHYRKAILERFLPRRKSMGLDDVPWYAGETGLSSVNGNEIVVAENVWKKVLFSIASGAADYVWYNLRATGWEENDPEAGFGLMTRDFQPRAGYAAFSSLATLLEGAAFERILVSEKTREAYLFRKGDGKFVVGWDSQCFEPVEIPIRADVAQATAIDLMGNGHPLLAANGTFAWKLGQRPSAIVFPKAKNVEPDGERLCAVADSERRIPVRAKAGFDREPDVVCEEIRFVHNSYEANPATVDRAWKGVKDHSFRAWFDLGEGQLRILVRVADDIHEQTASEPRLMSQGDCVRVDLRVPGLIGLWRLGFRRTNDGKSDSCVWVAPAGTDLEKSSAALRLKTLRTGGVTDYEMTIPFAEFSLSEKAFADGVGVWIMSDDNDGPGPDGWTGLSDGVVLTGDSKEHKEYVRAGRLCSEAPGAVFIEGETVSFRADGVPAGKSCRVLDWLGAAVAEGSVGTDGCVRMTGISVGYYRLSIEGCCDATFAVVPDPAQRVRDIRSFVGVDSALSWCWQPGSIDCPWYDGDAFWLGRELLIRSGVPHVRERLNWGEVQGRPDMSPQWGRYLVNARELSKSGVFVTDMFHDAPAWTGFVGRHLPSDLKALHGFCAAFARDFSGFVTDCEFWNEQDISNLSDEGAWDFAACMKAAFLGFRQGNPQLVVAPGAVCRDGRNAYDDVLYRNGMGKYCDVFNFHTYNSVASLPSLAADARNQLSRAGITGRALWMTECGTNREGPALGESGRKGIRAASPLQELLWAESIPKTQLVNLFNGISRSYTFVFAAHNEQGGIKDWGVVRRDGTVKPSFSALSTLAGEVGDGAELLGRLRLAGGKAVGYLFRKGDSSQTLVYWSLSSMDEGGGVVTELPLGERKFSLVAKDGEYRLTDMCGRVTRVRSSGGRLELAATRYPAYLSGLSGQKPEEAPVPLGSVGPVTAASDEDLSVVVRVDADKDDFRLGAGRSRLEMAGGRGKIRVSVWNLDSRAKRGTLTASGGTLSGILKDFAIPAGGVVRFDAVYTPDFKEGGCETELRIDGEFEGRRTTPCVVPMYSEGLFLKTARSVTLDAMRPERWKCNTSAQKYSCDWDEKERALRFDVEWTEPVDRWFYPQYALAEGESLEGARQLVFEVRTEQDKVENDFVATLAFFRSATSEYERPFRTWERRRVELPRASAEPLTGFSLGCNPKGHKLTFWLRNLQVVYGKDDKEGYK